jgi:hypothetical protein
MTHVDFIMKLKEFVNNFDLTTNFIYVTDTDNVGAEIERARGVTLVVSPLNTNLSDVENYNKTVSYGMTLVSKSGSSVWEVLNAEEDIMFIEESIMDYFNHLIGTDFNIANSDFAGGENGNGVTVTLSFTAEVLFKRRSTYWKGLDS